jgi:hypothetical protein
VTDEERRLKVDDKVRGLAERHDIRDHEQAQKMLKNSKPGGKRRKGKRQ